MPKLIVISKFSYSLALKYKLRLPRCDLDFNEHLIIHQSCLYHRRCWLVLSPNQPQCRPNQTEFSLVRYDVPNPDYVPQRYARLLQCRCDIYERLLGLFDDIVGNVASLVVHAVDL